MNSNDFGGIDFAAGSVKGLRSWRVDKYGRLSGQTVSRVWRPGENVSECADGYEGHRAEANCGCGFWAYYADQDRQFDKGVTGVIEGYGVVNLGTKGFRAEKARIVALALPKQGDSIRDRWIRWHQRHDFINAVAVVVGGIASVTALIAAIALVVNHDATWGILAFAGFLVLAAIALLSANAGFSDYRPRPATADLPYDLIRRNYPDVPKYRSVKAMLKAHPVDKAPEPHIPGPDDEGFWEMGTCDDLRRLTAQALVSQNQINRLVSGFSKRYSA